MSLKAPRRHKSVPQVRRGQIGTNQAVVERERRVELNLGDAAGPRPDGEFGPAPGEAGAAPSRGPSCGTLFSSIFGTSPCASSE